MLVNQKELSKILGVTDRRVRQLREEQGLFPYAEDTKKYNLAVCVQEYIRYKLEAESGSGSADYDKEHAEHERAKKEITKLKLRRLRRELHEAEDVEMVIGDMLTRFKAKLLSLPPKLGQELSGVHDVLEITALIKSEMLDALEELSRYDPEDYGGGEADNEDEPENDAAD